jgi:hypothetical protein
MKEHFKTILEAFENAGIEVNTAEFSITEYSLNTDLSFKFRNLDEFLEFLHLTAPSDEERAETINTILIEEGIDPSGFFYVNFYSPKVAEL